MKLLLLITAWIFHGNQVHCMFKEWQCSAQDQDGLVYFPDFPVDRSQLADAKIVTLNKEFFIFSITPDCTGRIIGADFCYGLTSDTNMEQRRVFQLVKLNRVDDTFVPDTNYTDSTFTGVPIDRTECTRQPSGRLVCCQRNTMDTGVMLDKEVLSYGILVQNIEMVDYPLLKFGVSRREYFMQAYRVEFEELSNPDDVFANVYNSSNKIQTVTSSPVFRFIIEPENSDSTLAPLTQVAPVPTVNLLAVIWCLVAVVVIAIMALVTSTGLAIAALMYYRRLKQAQSLRGRTYRKTFSQESSCQMHQKTPSQESINICKQPVPLMFTELPAPNPPLPSRLMYNSQKNTSYSLNLDQGGTTDDEDYVYDDISPAV